MCQIGEFVDSVIRKHAKSAKMETPKGTHRGSGKMAVKHFSGVPVISLVLSVDTSCKAVCVVARSQCD